METSHYKTYIDEFSPQLLPGLIEKLNGSLELGFNYLYKQELTPEFSISGQWQAQSYSGVLIEADFVSMDSPLPLKTRGSFASVGGAIPKLGTQRNLNEQELTDIQTMIALNTPRTAIALKLFQDTKAVIGGIFEKLEGAYHQGLSTGIALIPDAENVGIGIRVDYKYLPENKFGVPVVWSNPASKPISAIVDRIFAKAELDGKRVIKVKVDRATMNYILRSDEAKDMFAVNINNFGSVRPIPNLERLNDAVQAEYQFYFQVVDRTILRERDGNRTTYRPWKAGMAVAQTTENVGTLQYAALAEDRARVQGVDYQTVEQYMLISKFRETVPTLAEFTRSQARVIPVISETVYTMDSTFVTG